MRRGEYGKAREGKNRKSNIRLKTERLKTKYSQELLGEILGTTGRTIQRLEYEEDQTGKKHLEKMNLRDVIRLTQVLNRAQRNSELSYRCLFDNNEVRKLLEDIYEITKK